MRQSIKWVTVPEPPLDPMPRMDIAGLIGLARSGPLNTPVPIDNEGHFREIFGDDLPVARDLERQSMVWGCLGSAVRSFFQNGGQRCWVLRVAGQGAEVTRFPLSGLLHVRPGRTWEYFSTSLSARSEGSWADDLRVEAEIVPRKVQLTEAFSIGGLWMRLIAQRMPNNLIEVGDLLRLQREGETTYLVVLEVSPHPLHPQWQVIMTLPFTLTQPPLPTGPTQLRRLQESGEGPLLQVEVQVASANGLHRLRAPHHSLHVGDLLLWEDQAFLLVTAVEEPALSVVADRAGQPPGEAYDTVHTQVWTWQQPSATNLFNLEAPIDLTGATVEQLTLTLTTTMGDQHCVLADLGLTSQHQRFVGRLPSDALLFGQREHDLPALWQEAKAPRFPLCAPDDEHDHNDDAIHFVVPLLDITRTGHAEHSRASVATRDGLEHLQPHDFVDPLLAPYAAEGLAPAIAHQLSDARRPLRGAHAFWDNQEVTLLAMPDLAQCHWTRRLVQECIQPDLPETSGAPPLPAGFHPAAALAAPVLVVHQHPREGVLLQWAAPTGSLFEVQKAFDAEGGERWLIYCGTQNHLLLPEVEQDAFLVRVRARRAGEISPWSEWKAVSPPPLVEYVVAPADKHHRDEMIAVQAALLRLAAARGDLLCIFSLPSSLHSEEVRDHLRELSTRLGSDVEALANGILYFPWLAVNTPDGTATIQPPDGTMLGQFAHWSLREGPWRAPANAPVSSVVGLARAIWREQELILQGQGVNLMSVLWNGVRADSADTMSLRPDMRPVGERRLLMLIRRLLLREGQRLAFLPNDERLPDLAKQRITALLSPLYVRGAFSGATPAEAFRVEAKGLPEQGALEIRVDVAPSHPLTFLTLRLIQFQGVLSVQEG